MVTWGPCRVGYQMLGTPHSCPHEHLSFPSFSESGPLAANDPLATMKPPTGKPGQCAWEGLSRGVGFGVPRCAAPRGSGPPESRGLGRSLSRALSASPASRREEAELGNRRPSRPRADDSRGPAAAQARVPGGEPRPAPRGLRRFSGRRAQAVHPPPTRPGPQPRAAAAVAAEEQPGPRAPIVRAAAAALMTTGPRRRGLCACAVVVAPPLSVSAAPAQRWLRPVRLRSGGRPPRCACAKVTPAPIPLIWVMEFKEKRWRRLRTT